jgi:hypothetical protein
MPPTVPRNSNRGKKNRTLNNHPASTCRQRRRFKPDSSDAALLYGSRSFLPSVEDEVHDKVKDQQICRHDAEPIPALL